MEVLNKSILPSILTVVVGYFPQLVLAEVSSHIKAVTIKNYSGADAVSIYANNRMQAKLYVQYELDPSYKLESIELLEANTETPLETLSWKISDKSNGYNNEVSLGYSYKDETVELDNTVDDKDKFSYEITHQSIPNALETKTLYISTNGQKVTAVCVKIKAREKTNDTTETVSTCEDGIEHGTVTVSAIEPLKLTKANFTVSETEWNGQYFKYDGKSCEYSRKIQTFTPLNFVLKGLFVDNNESEIDNVETVATQYRHKTDWSAGKDHWRDSKLEVLPLNKTNYDFKYHIEKSRNYTHEKTQNLSNFNLKASTNNVIVFLTLRGLSYSGAFGWDPCSTFARGYSHGAVETKSIRFIDSNGNDGVIHVEKISNNISNPYNFY